MDAPFTFPATPGMALFPLSPRRVNALPRTPNAQDYQHSPSGTPSKTFGHPEFGVPGDFGNKSFIYADDAQAENPFDSAFQPLSLPGSPSKHSRANSEIQAMVTRFNSLDIKDHADLRRKEAAALKRAQMGREEAEAEAKRLRTELEVVQSQVEEDKAKETKVANRLDTVLDDLQRSKEVQAQSQALYEKEIRRAKKEAFKYSSTLVKLQDELKSARNVLRSMQSELDLERDKVQRREQDTFQAQYELASMHEEMERSLDHIKTLENEQQALQTSLEAEKTARLAAEAETATLAASLPRERSLSPQIKQRNTPIKVQSEVVETYQSSEELQGELEDLKWALSQAEDQLDFMKMECQTGCCSCRLSESQGQQFVHDGTFDREVQVIKAAAIGMLTPPSSVHCDTTAGNHQNSKEEPSINQPVDSTPQDMEISNLCLAEPATTSQVESQQPEVTSGSPYVNETRHENASNTALLTSAENDTLTEAIPIDEEVAPMHNKIPTTPHNSTVRPHTVTRTIPLVDHSNKEYSSFSTPTGLTREQAIEQLRQRRGRARSAAGTPRKVTDGGVTPRRDISAPHRKNEMTPGGSLRGRGR